jgi:hypothetical protein
MPLRIKGILLLLLLSISFTKAMAGLSYIYIQGDKQTPFYVKLEGEMQPRYGKNYCIIPKLAPGPIQIEILFQQNEYPAEKFTVIVPQDGFRGFMLTKKGGVYSLYDLQQSFYLSPGNTTEDDIAPVTRTPIPVETPDVAVKTPEIVEEPKPVSKPVLTTTKPKPVTNKPVATTTKPNPKPVVTKPVQEAPKPVANNEPNFIGNMELNNERTFGNTESTNTEEPATTVNQTPAIANSDCPKPLAFGEYQDVLEKARGKSDKNRLEYLLGQTDKCYTTIQVRALARSLTKDPERYAFLKQIFPHVTDQSNFSMLESTLQSKEWKEYFRLILP